MAHNSLALCTNWPFHSVCTCGHHPHKSLLQRTGILLDMSDCFPWLGIPAHSSHSQGMTLHRKDVPSFDIPEVVCLYLQQEAQVVAVVLLDMELVKHFSMSHMRAMGHCLNHMRMPVRLFIMSGPGRRCSLKLVLPYFAEQSNTTHSLSGFLGQQMP